MVRRYSSSFRPTWAVTVPTQNSDQPETEAPGFKTGEEDSSATDGGSTKPSEECGNGIHTPVASLSSSSSSSLDPKTSTVRSYSKVFPSLWTLPSKPSPPPPKIIEYRNPLDPINRSRVPQETQTDLVSASSRRYQRPRSPPSTRWTHRFSAESGEGDVAPRPPEGFRASTYSAPINQRSASPPLQPPHANYYVPPRPITARAPWEPLYIGYGEAEPPRIAYGRSRDPAEMPYWSGSRSSATSDLPARAPHVYPYYSN